MSGNEKCRGTVWRLLAGLSCFVFLLTAPAAQGQEAENSEIKQLVQELKDGDAGVRQNAALALVQFAKDDGIKVAFPTLIKALSDPDVGVRLNAAAAIREIGAAASAATPALAKLLQDDESSIRLIAAEALGEIGKDAGDSAEHLVKALGDDDGSVRIMVAGTIQKIARHHGGRFIRLLVDAMDDRNQVIRIRRMAAFMIGAVRYRDFGTQDFAPAMGRALGDRDGMIRRVAVKIIDQNRKLARQLVPELIDALADADVAPDVVDILRGISTTALPKLMAALKNEKPAIRRYATKVLSKSRLKDKGAVTALKVTLKEEVDIATRRFAALALGQANDFADLAVPALTDALANDSAATVRRSSALALKKFGRRSAPALPALKNALAGSDPYLQRYAAEALGAIGPKAITAGDALQRAMKTPIPEVRRAAATSLVRIGMDPNIAIHELSDALKHDKDAGLRKIAADFLGRMKAKAAGAVPALAIALRDPDRKVRIAAAVALGQIGPAAKEAIPALSHSLSNTSTLELESEDRQLRRDTLKFLANVALTLRKIGSPAVPTLIKATKHPDPEIRRIALARLGHTVHRSDAVAKAVAATLEDKDKKVRTAGLTALSRLGKRAAPAIPALLKQLDSGDRNFRRKLISIIVNLGPEGRKAIPALTQVLSEGNRSERVSALNTLAKVAEGIVFSNAAAPQELGVIDKTLNDLRAAMTEIDKFDNLKGLLQAAKVKRAIVSLEDKFWNRLYEDTIAFVEAYPVIGFGIPLYIVWVLFWILALWLAPRSLLKVNDLLRPLEAELPERFRRVRLPLRYLLFVGFLNYRPRVLDAWVASNVGAARERFARKRTVEDREVYIPVPVELDRKTVSDLTRSHARPVFGKRLGCLLVWGEGGSGKTSLACQIARWAMAEDPEDRICDHIMLPVLIEQELNLNVPDGRDPLTETIAKQVQDLTDQETPIREDLLKELLRQRRILVVIDHLSEMSEATQSNISPELSGFPCNAMIVTSRLEEDLGGITKTVIRPLRITGNRLSSFMEAYLTERGKREDFADAEFFDACRRLSAMVGDRDITLLLAKLYAEQMISAKSGEAHADLPKTIPDLMLSYLNELNLSVSEDRVEDREVHQVAKALAWECVRQTFRPTPAKYEDVLAALGGEDAKDRVDYLETRLRLCRSVQPAQEHVSILLDPLAEYLAGLHLVDLYGESETAWQAFLAEADSKFGAPWAIRGFLLAVRDCALARSAEVNIPAFVEPELRKRAAAHLSPVAPLASAA